MAIDIWSAFNKHGKQENKDAGEKQEISQYLAKFERARLEKEPTKEEHKKYLQAYRGEQWKKGGAPWQTRATINLIWAVVETMVPLMSDRQPEVQIYPTQPDDAAVAEQTQEVIQYRWNNDNMKIKLQKALRDMITFGLGILRMRWDSNLSYGLGDYTTENVDVFSFFPDDSATSTDDMEWFFIRYKQNRDTIKRLYKKEVWNTTDEDDDHYRDSDSYREKGVDSNQVDVYEYWHYNEEGIVSMVKFAGNTTLEKWTSPYNRNKFPFIFIHNHITNGEVFSYSDVKNLLPIQQQYNKINSVIMDKMLVHIKPCELLESPKAA